MKGKGESKMANKMEMIAKAKDALKTAEELNEETTDQKLDRLIQLTKRAIIERVVIGSAVIALLCYAIFR